MIKLEVWVPFYSRTYAKLKLAHTFKAWI